MFKGIIWKSKRKVYFIIEWKEEKNREDYDIWFEIVKFSGMYLIVESFKNFCYWEDKKVVKIVYCY